MKNIKLSQQKERLDQLFKRAIMLAGNDSKSQSHWACYLCVLICGFVENAVEELLSDFVKSRSEPEVSGFVSKELAQFQNPKFGKIAELLGKFSVQWKQTLETQTPQKCQDAVNSVVINRHKIAHGDHSGVTLATMTNWYKEVVKFIEFVESSVIQ